MNIKLKIRMHEIMFSCIGALLSLTALSQNRQMQMEEFAKPVETKGWIDFREGNTLDPQTLFTDKKEMFGLTEHDNMQQYRMQTDEIGFTHFRYQQYHKGLKIAGAETILHYNSSYLKSMNGYIAKELDINTAASLSEETAFENAKQSLKNVEYYVWENQQLAEQLSKVSNGQKDFSKPKGELMICRKNWNGDFAAENLAVVYMYRMIVLPMYESKDVYVDVKTGEVIYSAPLVTNCNNNTGNTSWYGNKSFNAGFFGWPNNTWFLESHCSGEATMRSLRGDPLVLYNYGDADGSWTDPDGANGYNQRAGVTTYWNIHKAYDYFRYNHSRLSYDYGNAQLDCFSEITGGSWLPSAENASWNSVTHHMSFGAGVTSASTDDWNPLDAVAHELTHGMHQWSIGYNYNGEPGALDESFADIFGVCAESYAKGSALPDWLIGNDIGYIRNMLNPNDKFDPDTYLGTYWQPTSNSYDYGGVHTNSGVQNFWFYLLTVGGTGTNDHGLAYNVSGIGIVKARNITYRSFDQYLTTSSGYIDAREGAIRAASDLFGWCSNEVLQTARAWHAVGVSIWCPEWSYNVPCGNVPSGAVYRGINELVTSSTCSTTIASGSSALFSATSGAGITLKPGFTAAQGCAFTATIDACNEAAYNRIAQHQSEEAQSKSSVENVQLKIDKVYPNPADNYVMVQYQSAADVDETKFTVSDLSGRTVSIIPSTKTEQFEFREIKLNVAQLPSGIYMLFIKDKTSSANTKLVITR